MSGSYCILANNALISSENCLCSGELLRVDVISLTIAVMVFTRLSVLSFNKV